MAIQVADNFQYLGQKPLDARVKYATVADMAAVAASSLYDGIMAYVVATEKNYQWKSTNTVDSTLGKWREFESGGGADNVVEGYRNPTNGLFYEEAAYTTAITGAANTLYVDLVTVGDAKDIYRWDGTGFVLENTRSQDIAYDNYQALSESEKNNGTTYYIPDATAASEMLVVGNRFDKANIYTATEKMIGSWMGKPLYQRVIQGTAISNSVINMTDIVSGGIPNADNARIIECYVTYTISNGTWNGPIPNSFDSTAMGSINITKDASKLYFGVLFNDYNNKPFTAIIQYTKTTDGTIKIGTENDYSTDEMIIGTWIDGKPLYQKCMSFTVQSSHTSVTNIPTGITNGAMGFVVGGYVHPTGANYVPINYNDGSGNYTYCGCTNDASNLRFKTTAGNAGATALAIIQYTKTTD